MNSDPILFAENFLRTHKSTEADARDPILIAENAGDVLRLQMRGQIIDRPMPKLPSEGFDYWTHEMVARTKNNLDSVVVIDGPEGYGKSVLGLRVGLAADPTFALSRICYTARDVIARYEDTRPGQVVMFDESARALIGTDTHEKAQKALIQALMLVQEKGIILFFVSHLFMHLPSKYGRRRAWLWISVRSRGKAIVHERDDRMSYKWDENELHFSRSVVAPLLTWEKFDATDPFWLSYLKMKDERLSEFLTETKDMLGGKRNSARGLSSEDRPKTGAERTRRWRAKKNAGT